jgi:hypothetical protein
MKLYDVEQAAQTDLVDSVGQQETFKPAISHGNYEDFKV